MADVNWTPSSLFKIHRAERKEQAGFTVYIVSWQCNHRPVCELNEFVFGFVQEIS